MSQPQELICGKPDAQSCESLPEYCIDAGSTGNVARFINHSCSPNLFVQCVWSSHHDMQLARVMLFAFDNIPPLQDGKYHEALGKWEAALILMPESAVLHEQKAQVLLEIGDAWNALRAATRAAVLEPSWAEAWITLGGAQLNFGEPDSSIESFDRALALKPVAKEAQDDRNTALQLVKRRKQLHVSGLNSSQNRFVVAER